jgi:hypothetical protein
MCNTPHDECKMERQLQCEPTIQTAVPIWSTWRKINDMEGIWTENFGCEFHRKTTKIKNVCCILQQTHIHQFTILVKLHSMKSFHGIVYITKHLFIRLSLHPTHYRSTILHSCKEISCSDRQTRQADRNLRMAPGSDNIFESPQTTVLGCHMHVKIRTGD